MAEVLTLPFATYKDALTHYNELFAGLLREAMHNICPALICRAQEIDPKISQIHVTKVSQYDDSNYNDMLNISLYDHNGEPIEDQWEQSDWDLEEQIRGLIHEMPTAFLAKLDYDNTVVITFEGIKEG